MKLDTYMTSWHKLKKLQEANNSSKKTFCYKILVIGDPGTGKTSLIRRYIHDVFSANYKATIGVDFALKILVLDEDKMVHLQMWDIAGQDRYGVMTRVYYKDAHGAVIVMDSTREATHEGAMRWKSDLDNKVTLADGSPVPAILLANKCDMDSNLSDDDLHQMEREGGFAAFFKTSAKENLNVEEAFKYLAHCVLSTERGGQYEVPLFNREGQVRLTDDSGRPREPLHKNSCCTIL